MISLYPGFEFEIVKCRFILERLKFNKYNNLCYKLNSFLVFFLNSIHFFKIKMMLFSNIAKSIKLFIIIFL